MNHSALRILALGPLAAACSYSTSTPSIRSADQPYVNKALAIYSKGKVTKEYLLQSVNPAVVYLPNMTCVGLNLRPGVLGGDTTMCFDKNGRQVVYYVNGD